jgi:hypothetical protein
MLIKKTVYYCTSYGKFSNYDLSVEQTCNADMSGKHVYKCAENCYGITKGVHSNLDKQQVISSHIYEL